ncbi:MAG: sensor histidine kinase [Chitinophagales bacterium]
MEQLSLFSGNWGNVHQPIAASDAWHIIESWPEHRREMEDLISGFVEETVHKVGNPLTAIKGFLNLFNHQPQDIPWEIVNEEIENIEQAMHEFQMLSRNHSGHAERVNLKQVISDMYSRLEALTEYKGIWLEVYLDPKCNVITVPDKLQCLISHLVSNAVQASPPGGVVSIYTYATKKQVILQIADNGCGIPDIYMDDLFRPFFSTFEGGSGLGLAICDQIVRKAGGTISVRSKVNDGTIVTVSVPKSLRKNYLGAQAG